MDSLTHIVLGAAVAEATLGRALGNKALVTGAVLATLPDVDVLIPFGSAVANFTWHRSFTHSLIILTLITPLLSWLGYRFSGRQHGLRWLACVWLALTTHVLLDSFTVYGTQMLWPLTDYPVAWSTIFIIDPVYTVPLLTGLVFAALSKSQYRRKIANTAGLTLSSAYLAWTIVAQQHAHSIAVQALNASSIDYHSVMTLPVPFSLLWRTIARSETSYYEGYYSLLDPSTTMQFDQYDTHEALLKPLAAHWPVQRLAWFTKGMYATQSLDGDIIMTDLRMGIEAAYVFSFIVGRETTDGIVPVRSEQRSFAPDLVRVGKIFRRQFDASVSLTPENRPIGPDS